MGKSFVSKTTNSWTNDGDRFFFFMVVGNLRFWIDVGSRVKTGVLYVCGGRLGLE